jgi:hypothetical protein
LFKSNEPRTTELLAFFIHHMFAHDRIVLAQFKAVLRVVAILLDEVAVGTLGADDLDVGPSVLGFLGHATPPERIMIAKRAGDGEGGPARLSASAPLGPHFGNLALANWCRDSPASSFSGTGNVFVSQSVSGLILPLVAAAAASNWQQKNHNPENAPKNEHGRNLELVIESIQP